MRKFLLGVLLLPAFAFAEPVTVEKPVICDTPKIVVESISGTYQEQPSWIGRDNSSKYALFVNEKTKTWTMIQFNDNIACIIGVGEGSKTVFTGPKT